jgi:S1-C subfamily serine protease
MSRLTRLAFTLACVGLLAASLAAAAQEGGYIGVQARKDADDKGIVIVDVVSGGPADKAGLKADDVVTKVNGNPVEDLPGFVKKVRDSKPGDKLKLTIERGGKEIQIELTVGKRPAEGG